MDSNQNKHKRFGFFRFMVTQVSGEVEVVEENRVLRAFKAVDLVVERRMVTLEWVASPVNGKFCFLFYSKFSSQVYTCICM